MKKFIAIFITCWLALLSWLPSVHAETFINANQLDAAAALAIDAKTGQILYSQNINQKLPIASISKLLTVMVIEDEISQHQLSWNTKVKINQKVAAIADDPEYSNVSLTQGQSYTVSDLVKAALIKSADGATVALAGALGDSTAQFNQKLQKKARQIGIKDATIVNSVGLTNSQLKDLAVKNIDDNAENKMSAKDVGKMAAYLVNHYPDLLKIAGQTSFQLDGSTVNNINKMLTDSQYQTSGVTIDGLKTGTSDAAGACLVSTATFQNRRIVTVVLHANGDSTDARFTATQKLYQLIANSSLTPQKTALSKSFYQRSVVKFLFFKHQIKLRPRSITIWENASDANQSSRLTIYDHLTAKTNRSGQLKAPIKKGQSLGYSYVKVKGVQFINNHGLRLPLISQTTVQ